VLDDEQARAPTLHVPEHRNVAAVDDEVVGHRGGHVATYAVDQQAAAVEVTAERRSEDRGVRVLGGGHSRTPQQVGCRPAPRRSAIASSHLARLQPQLPNPPRRDRRRPGAGHASCFCGERDSTGFHVTSPETPALMCDATFYGTLAAVRS